MAKVIVIVKKNTRKVSLKVNTKMADMKRETYDTNKSGKVDDAEKVNGKTVETAVPANALFTDTVLTLEEYGLENVDNTSDVDKPISTDTQEALDLKGNILRDYRIISVNSNMLPTDSIVECTEELTYALETAIGQKGRVIDIGNSSETATVTMQAFGSELVADSNIQTMLPKESFTLASNGIKWGLK